MEVDEDGSISTTKAPSVGMLPPELKGGGSSGGGDEDHGVDLATGVIEVPGVEIRKWTEQKISESSSHS